MPEQDHTQAHSKNPKQPTGTQTDAVPQTEAARRIASMPRPTEGSGRAVVLLSGGLDSSTVLAWAKSTGWDLVAVSFRYGQSHPTELEAARHQAQSWGVREHIVAQVDLEPVGGSALLGTAEVPKDRAVDDMGGDIPVTYVPARNALFLTYGLAVAEARGISEIFIGANAVDYSGYPDCRPEFLEAFERMALLATKMGTEGTEIHVRAPLLFMSKADIVAKAAELGVDLGHTWTCYDPNPDGSPCGHCDACQLRAQGFAQAGIADPLLSSSRR